MEKIVSEPVKSKASVKAIAAFMGCKELYDRKYIDNYLNAQVEEAWLGDYDYFIKVHWWERFGDLL